MVFIFLDVLEVRAQGHIQIVEAVRQVELIIVSRDCIRHHTNSVLFVPRDEAAPDAPLVVIQQVDWLRFNDFVCQSPILDTLCGSCCNIMRAFLFFVCCLFLFFNEVNDVETSTLGWVAASFFIVSGGIILPRNGNHPSCSIGHCLLSR